MIMVKTLWNWVASPGTARLVMEGRLTWDKNASFSSSQQSNNGNTTGKSCHLSDDGEVGTTSERRDSRGCGGKSCICSGGWDCAGSSCHGLGVRELREKSRGHLGLTVRDLAQRDRGGAACLWLSVGNLSNGSSTGTIWLSIAELRNGGWTSRLAITGLSGDRGAWSTGGTSSFAGNDVQSDRRALRGPVGIVQVVEAARQALVEDGGGTKSDRRVAADREAGGVDGTSLRRTVKLELVIGGDVGGAALSILHDTTVDGNDKSTRSTAGSTLWNSISLIQLATEAY